MSPTDVERAERAEPYGPTSLGSLPDSFNCLIVGQTGCGKTHLLLNMIFDQIIKFDCIQLYSRSLHQRYYQFLKHLIEHKIDLDSTGKQLFDIATEIDEWDAEILLDACEQTNTTEGTSRPAGLPAGTSLQTRYYGHLSPDGLEDLEDNCSKEGYFYDSIDELPDPNDLKSSENQDRPPGGDTSCPKADGRRPMTSVAGDLRSTPSDTSCPRHLIIFDDLIDEKIDEV